MNSQTHASVMGNRKNKAVVETVAQIVFTICAFFAVLAVVSITLYMIISGTPAILKVGLNLFSADSIEYINEKLRFGHWKDNAIMVKGDAARSFTMMFLQMWQLIPTILKSID